MSPYHLHDSTAHLSLENGKVNALSLAVLAELHAQLDRALQDGVSAVVITGRPGVFCAGFDLTELRSEDSIREQLRRSLIDLELRLFEFERPVIIACTGHALAAGAALLLAADRRIGIDGSFRLGFNEVTMGASISAATVELARYRMPMPWFESLI
jgi:enoyl-CoA hydratase